MDVWPALKVADWVDTRDTLQLWTQMVGKIRMELSAPINHWWHVTLYVSARGLRTAAIPNPAGGAFDVEFDLIGHQLVIRCSDGATSTIELRPRTTADLHDELFARLHDLGIDVRIFGLPVELPDVIPFATDTVHASYDPDAVRTFHGQLLAADRVLQRFRSEFRGKVSPVHFFWGAFDLAVTRFSGRPAPLHPGGIPNCPDRVMAEAYSDEVSSCGFWPGGPADDVDTEGTFYAYAYPEPEGYRLAEVSHGRFDTGLGEFVLPYAEVRTADDPDAVLLEFLRQTHRAAAELADWP
jgi:hypothetical protein